LGPTNEENTRFGCAVDIIFTIISKQGDQVTGKQQI